MVKNLNNSQSDALEAMLSHRNSEMEQEIKINAQSFGQLNLPKLDGDGMASYFEEHHFQCQQMIDHVNTELQFQSTCHQVGIEEKDAQEKIKGLRNGIGEQEHKKIQLSSELKSLPASPSMLKFIIVTAILIGISLFEGVMAIPIFEIWGFNLAESIVCGVLFAVVIAAFAHASKRLIEIGRTPTQKRMIAVGILIFMTLLFAYMARTRAEYLSTNASETTEHIIDFSPVPFVLISLLLFIVAVSLCVFYMPNKEQRAIMKTKARLSKQLKSLNSEIDAKKSEIDAISERLIAVKASCASILVRGCMLEELIINRAKSGLAMWKRQNLMHRQDNMKPTSFDQLYPFTFTTYFHSIKSIGNENKN